jgi:hypothetical protein
MEQESGEEQSHNRDKFDLLQSDQKDAVPPSSQVYEDNGSNVSEEKEDKQTSAKNLERCLLHVLLLVRK